MPENSRLSGTRDWIDMGFEEHERTPESGMALGIQSHDAGSCCRIPSNYSKTWVSSAVGKRSMIGCRKPISSPNLTDRRLRSSSTTQ